MSVEKGAVGRRLDALAKISDGLFTSVISVFSLSVVQQRSSAIFSIFIVSVHTEFFGVFFLFLLAAFKMFSS